MTHLERSAKVRIVVGYDGSTDSDLALAWATRESKVLGASLELISTWEMPTGLGWSGIPSNYNPAADVQPALDKAMESVRVAHPEITITALVVQGPPGPTLVEASRGASLLVVGTRGHGELAGLLIGSVSQYSIAHAHCPVVVIRTEK